MSARATLSRGPVVYATGYAYHTRGGSRTTLLAARPVRRGRYTLDPDRSSRAADAPHQQPDHDHLKAEHGTTRAAPTGSAQTASADCSRANWPPPTNAGAGTALVADGRQQHSRQATCATSELRMSRAARDPGRASGLTKAELCRWPRAPPSKVLLLASEVPEQQSSPCSPTGLRTGSLVRVCSGGARCRCSGYFRRRPGRLRS